ncbi:hypothetical protein B0H66DRAFT_558840 [Apodospora peruviana]|uniref:Uncharacterized protein n=1 Tax=Apodospora peruviana TaxID=516989 RepID=A0AAE0I6B4_9PEZI|nr:hypothetical protein B0H66DRAFT_558840 [Apodospora peruviana]
MESLFLAPALPSELLWFIIHSCTFPTTLIICSTRTDFLTSLITQEQAEPRYLQQQTEVLAAAPLYQVAVARHIRIVFIPTVSHLRAYLSVFSADDSKVPPPPPTSATIPHNNIKQSEQGAVKHPLLIIYGFLSLHRDTSEWSVQGLNNTSSIFVETAQRIGFQAVIIEPKTSPATTTNDSTNEEVNQAAKHYKVPPDDLSEPVPILSGSARRVGPVGGLEESGSWAGRTVDVRRVLGRWFRFQTTLPYVREGRG